MYLELFLLKLSFLFYYLIYKEIFRHVIKKYI